VCDIQHQVNTSECSKQVISTRLDQPTLSSPPHPAISFSRFLRVFSAARTRSAWRDVAFSACGYDEVAGFKGLRAQVEHGIGRVWR
jgi:hypothetical protein